MTFTAVSVERWDDAGFREAIQSGVVLAEFYAPWSSLSATQARALEKVAEATAGHARIGRVDVESATQTASRLGIVSAPTLVLFRAGKEEARFIGIQPPETLTDAVGTLTGNDRRKEHDDA